MPVSAQSEKKEKCGAVRTNFARVSEDALTNLLRDLECGNAYESERFEKEQHLVNAPSPQCLP